MDFLPILLFAVSGLALGSFIGAFTYRLPRGESVFKGRSKCTKCGKKIAWYDNIPLFSYLLLGSKCRHCKETISPRYPAVELAAGIGFAASYFLYIDCASRLKNLIIQSPICLWYGNLGFFVLPFLLFVFLILVSIFVIDLEKEFIPDELVFTGFLVSFLSLIFFRPDSWYINILSAFGAALFLLFIHLVTKGKGMGLGDVKLALFAGLVLGWPYTAAFLLLAFISGALVGVILVLFGFAKFKEHIPFGPFMVFSFLLILLWGDKLLLLIT